MNILAIDTSGPVCGVCVSKDALICYEANCINKYTHSVNMMPMIEEALQKTGLDINGVDLFAAVKGPGSFTGVRIGISAVKALAHACGKPCIGIDALEALAYGVSAYGGLICPVQDARAGQVYGAIFRSDGESVTRLSPDEPIRIEEFCQKAGSFRSDNEKVLFLGDGMPVHRETISSLMNEYALFAPANLCYLHASSVSVLAQKQQANAVDCYSLSPFYLRAPQAERQKNLRENGHE